MTRARIVGIGAYAPKRILTNAELEKMVDTSDEWIVQRTGIRERHIVEEGEGPADLAIRAAHQAMERAQVTPEEIDFIVVGTTAPAPSPNSTQVVRSLQSRMREKVSAPTQSTVRYFPVWMYCAPSERLYTDPAHAA